MDWAVGDDPFQVHKASMPTCDFVRELVEVDARKNGSFQSRHKLMYKHTRLGSTTTERQ